MIEWGLAGEPQRQLARLSADDHLFFIPVPRNSMLVLAQEARSSQTAALRPLESSSSTGNGLRKRFLILSSSSDSLLSSSEVDICSGSDGEARSDTDEPHSSSPAPDVAAANLEPAEDYTQPSPSASWSFDAELAALEADSQSLGQLDDVTDKAKQDEGAEDEEDELTCTQESRSALRKSVFCCLGLLLGALTVSASRDRALAYIEHLLLDFFSQLRALAIQSSEKPLLSYHEKVVARSDSEFLESGGLVHQIVLEATGEDKASLTWPRRTGKGTDTTLTLKMG